jgi:hypothetical protein
MAGLVPAIYVFAAKKAWMPGTRPGMTVMKPAMTMVKEAPKFPFS